MLLDGNQKALKTYLAGERESEAVLTYFRLVNISVPR